MQLSTVQLDGHLQSGLASVYLLAGEEPFQLIEAVDRLRVHARQQGYIERVVIHVDTGFDWASLREVTGNLSLFVQRRLIELRMPGKPGVAGSSALMSYAERPPQDTVLMIQTGKLERGVQNSAWVKAIDKAGVVLNVWPLDSGQLREWILRRFQQRGFNVEQDSVEFLASRIEGNLLAAAQEIDKLCLSYEPGLLDYSTLVESVVDSARYNVFDLADSALAGKTSRAVKVLFGLKAEGINPTLVLWSLSEQVRAMVPMSRRFAQGESVETILRHVWQKRKSCVKHALQSRMQDDWETILMRCAEVERVIKSGHGGREWEELLQLVLDISDKETSKLLSG